MIFRMTRRDQSIKRALIAGTALAGAILLTAQGLASDHAAFADALRAELGIAGSQTTTLRNPGKTKGARAGALDGESQILNGFYGRQNFRAIWFTSRGATAKAKLFLDRLGRAGEHGLEPEDYGYASLAAGAKTFSSSNRAALEVAMSRAFARYAADVNAGRIHPTRRVPGLYIRPVRPDPERLLVAAATTKNFGNYVDSLSPRTPQYARLLKAMAYYRAIAARGGWQPVAPGPTLKPGMSDPRVAQIKARLRIVGDLKAKGATPNIYTPALIVAVKRFQYRHGLEQDGNVGKTTLKAMNVPAATRIDQMSLNLERRRWMPDDLGDKYVFVNIADQYLKLVTRAHSAKPKTIHTARVVVGRRYFQTPIFSGIMSFALFNPHWNVPQSIARKEMLPKIKKNPGYLAANHYMLLTRPVDNQSAISASSVDWNSLNRSNFPYYIRQKPGPWNALGEVIFMFPNPHNIFIHDTTARSLFGRNQRSFSHGCIRLQNPHSFGLLVLKANGNWTRKRIDALVETRKEVRINLKVRLPVHITYLTAWSNKDGTHHFRRDIYSRDKRLKVVLVRALATAKARKSKGPGRSG